MSNERINISVFPKHLFWNYCDGVDLDKSIVIENVIFYGELNDYETLLGLVSKDDIRNVIERFEKIGKYKKRINFVNKIILS